MGKSEALETALNNKLLSSPEHLKKGVFSPTPPVFHFLRIFQSIFTYLFIFRPFVRIF